MFDFETNGANTYLVYKIKPTDKVDTMGLGMLTNNKINGLEAAIYTQLDNEQFIKFNVSSKVSVKLFFTGPINKKRMVGVFLGILNAMISAEDYMLDTNTIIFDLDYMFTDVSTCETVLICLPIIRDNVEKIDLAGFFRNIIFTTQFDQTENCDYVAKLLNYLNSSQSFSIYDFKALLEEINNSDIKVQSNEINQAQISHQAASNIQQSAPNMQPAPNMAQPIPNMAQPTPGMPQQIPSMPQSTPNISQSVTNIPQTVPAQQMDKNMQNAFSIPQNNSKENNSPFQIPNQQGKVNTSNNQNSYSEQSGSAEKPMSMMNLLMHYSKDNKKIYKEQKQKKKTAKEAEKQNANMIQVPGDINTPFAVPGAPHQMMPPQQMPVSNKSPNNSQAKDFSMGGGAVQQTNIYGNQGNNNMNFTQAQNMPVNVPQNVNQPNPNMQQVSINVKPANFGETTVLGGGIGETTVLSKANSETNMFPYIFRKKTGERIDVDKPVFRIGKERSYVDFFVSDNTAVSRSHANILTKDGKYYIVDTNSTNHTYLNGQMLQSNVEYTLSSGSVIRIANEDFEFRV